ncbi:MAG TPA: CHAT domain-containing protein, partial [Pseudonocardiaceae bacterium]|nr:CHAT domain-containing protein [Pseudonocardiaceae bacterium]
QRVLVNRGILLAERHEFAAARADLVEADGLARELGRDLAVGIITENLGFAESLRGDVPAALACLDRAERIISRNRGQVAPLLQDRGELLLSVGLAAEARVAAERAVLAYRREHRQLKVPEARLLLAQAAFLDQDWPGAYRYAVLAAREFGRQGRVGWTELARITALRAALAMGRRPRVRDIESIVDTLVRVGWPVAAVEARLVAARLGWPEQLRAAGRARRRGPVALRARAWYAEALSRMDGAEPAMATRAARTGLRLLDEHAATLGATDLRAHSAAHRRELTELGLRIAMASGRPGRVFEWAERGRSSRLLFRPVRPPHDPVLADLLVEARDAARHGRSTVALERRIRDHTRMHGGDAGSIREPVAVGALREVLGELALVQFVQFGGVLHALTLVSGRLRLRRLGSVADLTGLLVRLPFALQRMSRNAVRPASRAAAVALLRDTAARLDDVLLRPLPELGDRAMVVVPTGVLHSLPWSVLPSCVGRPVSVSPSATSWHDTSTRPRAEDGPVLVAAGPGLAGGRSEALAVAALHRTDALVDGDATVPAVLAGLGAARVAHLATHGTLSAANPLFSSLLLHDGPLVVHDLERLARLPDTVVLAACDSGRSVVLAGDELLGLGATFIARGTAELIASVVPIPDAATTALMVALHRRLTAGWTPAIALAAAQRAVRDDGPASVAAAAGFVCLGAGHVSTGPVARP